MSTNTILFNPVSANHSSSPSPPRSRPLTAKLYSTTNTGTHTPAKLHSTTTNTGTHTPTSALPTGHRTPRHSIYTTAATKPRPIMPSRQHFQSVPNFNLDTRTRQIRHRVSSLDMGMSDLGLENNAGMLGAVPSSFATQMAFATGGLKAAGKREDTDSMMGRLMLARMKTLEEGFAEVVREFRGMRTAGNSSVEGTGENIGPQDREKGKGRENRRRKKVGIVRTTSELDFGKMEGTGVVAQTPEELILGGHGNKGSSL